LTEVRNAGQLVKASRPVPDGRPGMYSVTVRLAPIVVRQPPTRPGFWTGRAAPPLPPASVLAVLTAVGVAVYLVLAWVAAHLAGVLAVLVLAALIAGVAMPRVCKTVVTVTHKH
jgi:hypothetical protein